MRQGAGSFRLQPLMRGLGSADGLGKTDGDHRRAAIGGHGVTNGENAFRRGLAGGHIHYRAKPCDAEFNQFKPGLNQQEVNLMRSPPGSTPDFNTGETTRGGNQPVDFPLDHGKAGGFSRFTKRGQFLRGGPKRQRMDQRDTGGAACGFKRRINRSRTIANHGDMTTG